MYTMSMFMFVILYRQDEDYMWERWQSSTSLARAST